jgi:twinkle protein
MNYYSPVGTVISEARSTNLSSTAARWAEQKRRITAPTLERLGVASDTVYFPDIGKKSEALVFHYREGWKARAVPEKSFVAGKGFKLSFWNEEAVLMANPETVFITEGELDCAALVEAGIPSECVLSVPNGAKQREADSPSELKGYGYVDEALRSGLSRVKRFVWCGDGDGPGLSLRSDMARLLGAARFCFVEWPDGCKDANEVLISDGDLFLRELVTDGSLPWPVKGLYRLNELPEPPPMTRWHPGFSEWESKVMLAPRTLSVVTGHPGNGKTLLFTQIWFQIVQASDVHCFV